MPKGAPKSHSKTVHGNNAPRKKRGVGRPNSKATVRATTRSARQLRKTLNALNGAEAVGSIPAVVVKVLGGRRFLVKSLVDGEEYNVRLGNALKLKKGVALAGEKDVAVRIGTHVLTDKGDILAIIPAKKKDEILEKMANKGMRLAGIAEENNLFNRTVRASPKSSRSSTRSNKSNKSSKSAKSNFSFSRKTRRNRH
jgi:hypothetical protein